MGNVDVRAVKSSPLFSDGHNGFTKTNSIFECSPIYLAPKLSSSLYNDGRRQKNGFQLLTAFARGSLPPGKGQYHAVGSIHGKEYAYTHGIFSHIGIQRLVILPVNFGKLP